MSDHLEDEGWEEATYPLPLSLLDARPRSGASGSGRSVEAETATMRGTRKSSVKKSGLSWSFLRRLRLLELPSLLRLRGMVRGWVSWAEGPGGANGRDGGVLPSFGRV